MASVDSKSIRLEDRSITRLVFRQLTFSCKHQAIQVTHVPAAPGAPVERGCHWAGRTVSLAESRGHALHCPCRKLTRGLGRGTMLASWPKCLPGPSPHAPIPTLGCFRWERYHQSS